VKSLLLFLVLACSTFASAQAPVVRASLAPAKGIIVGQPVHLSVEILVPNFFTGPPEFPIFELENAIVVLPEETPANLNEQINGHSYAGIRRTYFIYPQQPADFRLPPAQLTVSYAKSPPATTMVHLTLPPLTFHAAIPAAAEDLDYFLPTTSLTMQQRWSYSPKNVRVGDTLERTITITTTRMQGMLIPPLPMNAPPGIRIYPEEAKVVDQKTDRGEFVFGRRTQSAKYFIQKEGNYTLPAIELKWWNLGSHQMMTATLPTIVIIAAPNPSYTAELPPEPEILQVVPPKRNNYRTWYRKALVIAPVAAAVLLVLWLAYRYIPRLLHWSEKRREQALHSEAAYFHNLIRACRRNDGPDAYRWLLRWLQRFGSTGSLNSFLEQSREEELSKQVEALAESLFSSTSSTAWNGRAMAHLLQKHRNRSLLQLPRRTQLPLLNP
jgi:hypothetical protein